MNRPELFERTVSILVSAYRSNALEHSICTACAVGNIVNATMYNNNETLRDATHKKHGYLSWAAVFSTDAEDGEQRCEISSYDGLAKLEIDSTGYTLSELMQIEYAFETAEMPGYITKSNYLKHSTNDEWMLNGLHAVYNVLCEIHEIDLGNVAKAEEVFVHAV